MSGPRPKSIILAIIIISKRRWAGKLNLFLRPDFHIPCAYMYVYIGEMAKCSHKWPNNVGGTFEGSPFVLSMSECQPAIYISVHMFVPICALCL